MHKAKPMRTEHGKIEGDIEIDSQLTMHGIFAGKVTVKSGGFLVLHGMATKDLVVEHGAVVEVPGMVAGNVINSGGMLSVTGTVTGQVIEQAGETEISPNASIG